MKIPNIGDTIEHTESAFDRVNIGKVSSILSSQFIYQISDGRCRICTFKEDWKVIKKARPKLKNWRK